MCFVGPDSPASPLPYCRCALSAAQGAAGDPSPDSLGVGLTGPCVCGLGLPRQRTPAHTLTARTFMVSQCWTPVSETQVWTGLAPPCVLTWSFLCASLCLVLPVRRTSGILD